MTSHLYLLAYIIFPYITTTEPKFYKTKESFKENINDTQIEIKLEILLANEGAFRFFFSISIDVKRMEDGSMADLVSTSINKILQLPTNLSNEIKQGLKDTSKNVSLDLNSIAQYVKSVMGLTLSFLNFELESGVIKMKLRPSVYTVKVPYIRFILEPKEFTFTAVTDQADELVTKYLSQKATSNIYETGGKNTQIV